jgi:hypothetical protein
MPILPRAVEEIKTVRLRTEPQRDQDTDLSSLKQLYVEAIEVGKGAEGKEAVCPKCGNIVKPKVLQWALYLVGDTTDEIIASFPPSIMNRPTERMVIVAQGLLGENEEFLVYRWSLPSESAKTIAPTTDQTLTPFFKPIATNSPTNGYQ